MAEVEQTPAKEPEFPKNSPMYEAMKAKSEREPVVETPAEPVTEPIEPVVAPEGGETAPITDKPYEFAYKPAWEKLEKDGIKIPDEFKQGKFGEGVDEWSALHDLIIENTEFEPENDIQDPFIQNYLQVPEDKREEYIQEYQNAQQFFKLDADTGLKAWYQAQTKTEDGKEVRKYTDEAIDKHLETLSPIQKEEQWNQTKSVAQKQFDEVYKKGTADRTQQQTERITKINEGHLETARQLGEKIDAMKEFAGVPLPDEVKKNAKRDLILFTQIDPTTGRPHLLNLLNDNDKLMRFIIAGEMSDGELFQEHITTQNEKFAKMILNEKLDVAPKPKAGSSVSTPNQPHKPRP